tara:strand:- start:284 stop:670 length:387 start_codon:yes stop_codon:yes gene_type:complete
MAEENEVENDYNPIADLVQHSLDQDYNNASKVFSDVMSVKLNDVMDQEQVKLAGQVYSGYSEEDDDDQLELDLGSEQPDDDTPEEDWDEEDHIENDADDDDEEEMEDDEEIDDEEEMEDDEENEEETS